MNSNHCIFYIPNEIIEYSDNFGNNTFVVQPISKSPYVSSGLVIVSNNYNELFIK